VREVEWTDSNDERVLDNVEDEEDGVDKGEDEDRDEKNGEVKEDKDKEDGVDKGEDEDRDEKNGEVKEDKEEELDMEEDDELPCAISSGVSMIYCCPNAVMCPELARRSFVAVTGLFTNAPNHEYLSTL
jgi:hypothetical protein